MRFSGLVSYTKEFGKRKTDLLIVISSLSGYDFVIKHLSYLKKQTYLDFNVLLVIGPPFEDRRILAHFASHHYPFGIIVAKENERRGCTGGFFTGQKYALEQHYDYMIMGDDDCMPVDKRLVEALYRNRKRDYVAATMVFVEDGYRKKGIVGAPTSYSLLSANFMRHHGLYYLPLFHGADDAEYMERVKTAPFSIPNNVEHPYIVGMRLFSMFDRAWFFLLQGIMIIRSLRTTLYNLALCTFMCCIALAFLPPYGRKLFFTMNRLLLTYTYGKKAGDRLKSGYQGWIFEMEKSRLSGFFKVNEKDPSAIDEPGKKKFFGMAKQALCLARKDVAIEKTYSFMLAFFLAITARKVYVKVGTGKYLLFADNSLILLHAAKLLLFAISLPLQAMAAALFLPIKLVRYPNTKRYGLD